MAATSANNLCPNCQKSVCVHSLQVSPGICSPFAVYFLAGKVSCIIHIRHWDWNGEIVIQSVPSAVGGSTCKDLLFLIDPSQGHRFPLNAFSPSSYPVTWRSFLQVFFFFFFFVYDIFFQFPVFCENCSMCQHISDVVLGEVSSISSYSTL